MNKENTNNDDFLRKFLNPGKTEQAPQGFSTKTMARIMIEKQSEPLHQGFLLSNRVPIVSAAVTLVLILCAIFVPAGDNGSLGTVVWSYLNDIKMTLPRFDNSWFENSAFPLWIGYVVPGILILMFFDIALSSFFRKKDNPGH